MKNRFKVAVLAAAVVLTLPAVERWSGTDVVRANASYSYPPSTPPADPSTPPALDPDATSTVPTPTPTTPTPTTPASTPTPTEIPSQTPAPTQTPSQTPIPTETPSQTPIPSATPVPSLAPAARIEEPEDSLSDWVHEHSFEYVRVQEATETQDAIMQLQCSCGVVSATFAEAGSAGRVFIERVIREINNAPENGTVTVNTDIWTCYNRQVIEALAQRPDVTVVTNYCYEKVDYTVTIPAGYDVMSLTDENGYCGFRYLDQVFGGSRR